MAWPRLVPCVTHVVGCIMHANAIEAVAQTLATGSGAAGVAANSFRYMVFVNFRYFNFRYY